MGHLCFIGLFEFKFNHSPFLGSLIRFWWEILSTLVLTLCLNYPSSTPRFLELDICHEYYLQQSLSILPMQQHSPLYADVICASYSACVLGPGHSIPIQTPLQSCALFQLLGALRLGFLRIVRWLHPFSGVLIFLLVWAVGILRVPLYPISHHIIICMVHYHIQ